MVWRDGELRKRSSSKLAPKVVALDPWEIKRSDLDSPRAVLFLLHPLDFLIAGTSAAADDSFSETGLESSWSALGMRTEAIVFFAVVALFGLYWTYRTVAAGKADRAWKAVADLFGFYFRDTPIRLMEGRHEGVEVKVETVTMASHEGFDGHATNYRVSYPSLSLGLYITRKGEESKVGNAPSARDVEIGHKPFDESFFVVGNDPEALKRFLTPARRMGIERLFSVIRGPCAVEDERIVHEHGSVDNDGKVVLSKVFTLLRTAKVLVEDEEDDRPFDGVAARQEEEKALFEMERRLRERKASSDGGGPASTAS